MAVGVKDSEAAIDLAGQVDRALWNLDAVRTARRPIRTQVGSDGRVTLLGPVRSRLVRDQILDLVGAIPGVLEVIDRMVADPELELRVAEALSHDPRTRSIPPGSVQVHSLNGAVTLTGQLPPGSDRAAVLQAARSVPGVVQVHDRLT